MSLEQAKGRRWLPGTDERWGMDSSKGAPSLGEPETARSILGAIPYLPYGATMRASIARRLSGGHQGCIGKMSSKGTSSPWGLTYPINCGFVLPRPTWCLPYPLGELSFHTGNPSYLGSRVPEQEGIVLHQGWHFSVVVENSR